MSRRGVRVRRGVRGSESFGAGSSRRARSAAVRGGMDGKREGEANAGALAITTRKSPMSAGGGRSREVRFAITRRAPRSFERSTSRRSPSVRARVRARERSFEDRVTRAQAEERPDRATGRARAAPVPSRSNRAATQRTSPEPGDRGCERARPRRRTPRRPRTRGGALR